MLGLWKEHSIRNQEPYVQNLVYLPNSCVVPGIALDPIFQNLLLIFLLIRELA